MLDKNKIGMAFGIFLAVFHAAWALMVAVIPETLQSGLNWIFRMHFLEPVWILTQFNFSYAILLVVFTFIVGYILGWVFAWAHNLSHKKK